jgi:hypothetical protein
MAQTMTLSDIQGRVEHAFNLLYAIDLHEAVNVVPDRLLTDLNDLTHALAALSNGMAQELLARFPKED